MIFARRFNSALRDARSKQIRRADVQSDWRLIDPATHDLAVDAAATATAIPSARAQRNKASAAG